MMSKSVSCKSIVHAEHLSKVPMLALSKRDYISLFLVEHAKFPCRCFGDLSGNDQSGSIRYTEA
jgi:hypothetical protein